MGAGRSGLVGLPALTGNRPGELEDGARRKRTSRGTPVVRLKANPVPTLHKQSRGLLGVALAGLSLGWRSSAPLTWNIQFQGTLRSSSTFSHTHHKLQCD
jgi:hypothetical protein